MWAKGSAGARIFVTPRRDVVAKKAVVFTHPAYTLAFRSTAVLSKNRSRLNLVTGIIT